MDPVIACWGCASQPQPNKPCPRPLLESGAFSCADVSFTTAEYRALTGMTTFSPVPDPGPPILFGSDRGIAVCQFTDGQLPPVDAIFVLEAFVQKPILRWGRHF